MDSKQEKVSEVWYDCGDCGHPVYKDGTHNPFCQKESEKDKFKSDYIKRVGWEYSPQ
jgi:hypothetical protein